MVKRIARLEPAVLADFLGNGRRVLTDSSCYGCFDGSVFNSGLDDFSLF